MNLFHPYNDISEHGNIFLKECDEFYISGAFRIKAVVNTSGIYSLFGVRSCHFIRLSKVDYYLTPHL